jgi:hypothetical protein
MIPMPYRLGFTKPSCRTVQRIERCPEKAQFAKATLTVAEAGWGKEAGWLSTGGRNASLVIMRPARFMVGHLHWYLAVIVVCCATVLRWCSSRQSLRVDAGFHPPARDLTPKMNERAADLRGLFHTLVSGQLIFCQCALT